MHAIEPPKVCICVPGAYNTISEVNNTIYFYFGRVKDLYSYTLTE